MNLQDVVVDKEGKQVDLNKWIYDEESGEREMFTRTTTIAICENHAFDKQHECTRCPFVFTGFRGHLHIQKADGIYDRKTGEKIA